MTTDNRVRAQTGVSPDDRAKPIASLARTDLSDIAQNMFSLMLRNVTTDGYVLNDPITGNASLPGCIIAAPCYPRHTPGVDQDYVFNWVRDAAITAMEIAVANVPEGYSGGVQTLIDYVNFAKTCQDHAQPTLGHACFAVDGSSRPWTEQSDGPALQTLAMMHAYALLDAATQATATSTITVNLGYLLAEYQNPTTNLWEEHAGLSFFARSTQLQCFREVSANTLGIPVPAGVGGAITWLESALAQHWNGSYYMTMLAPPSPGNANGSAVPGIGYDPNIDIICASLYGAIPVTDTKLLATAALLRSQWSDAASPSLFPINSADQVLGIGPLLGRYPGDTYDGDTPVQVVGGHPWPLCTANLAELYYRLANAIDTSGTVPLDALSAGFFTQIGVGAGTAAVDASTSLREAGDAALRAVIYHSDHLELSEQFDGSSGFEKSVTNLTWSYAAFLSAVRAKTGQPVRG